MKKLSIVLLSICSLASLPAYAQIGNASFVGIVRDDSDNPLPGASVLARNIETGLERNDITDESGAYHIPFLPFGTYDLTAEISGFATLVKKDIQLDSGRTLTINFTMKLSTVGETIEVNGDEPWIESSDSHIITYINHEQIKNLPVISRQCMALAALAPGTTLTNFPDPSKLNSEAISITGGTGRNVHLSVDGGDNNDDTIGGIGQSFSLDSIAQISFLTNRYKAEYGRSTGGIFNIVTQSGTNELHGSFFTLFRNDALNSLSEAEKRAGLTQPAPYSREQFGGTLGGPIVKDRLHFFVTAEREQLDIPVVVNTQGIAPEFDGPHNAAARNNLVTAKITSILDPRQYLTVRYGQQAYSAPYGVAPWYAPNAWGTNQGDFHSLLASHYYVLTDDKLNEFLFQYSDMKYQILPVSYDPIEIFRNGIYLGQNPNTLQAGAQTKYQFKDGFSWTGNWKGSHQFKTGVNFIHEPTLEWEYDQKGPWFEHLENSRDSAIIDISMFGGSVEFSSPNNQTGIYLQDDWNLGQHLTLNLGLRYDLITGLSIDQSSNPVYQSLHNSTYDFAWLRPFQENADGQIEMDKNNVQPRLGFAYDWKGDGTAVIHGGYGIYYDFPYINANLLFPLAALGEYSLIYSVNDESGIRNADGSIFRIGDPLPPNQLASVIPKWTEALSPDWKVPYTRETSIGFSYQVAKEAALDVDYIHSSGRDRYLRFQFNGILPGQTERMLPNFGKNARLYFVGGYSDYDGFHLSYRQRVKGIQLQAAYTLSKVEGNLLLGSDEFRTGSSFPCTSCALDFALGPVDDPRMKGPLYTNAQHRFVLAAIVDLPKDFMISGFFRANSANPFNGLATTDLNGDGILYDTPDPHVNSHSAGSFSQLDIRVSKGFSFGDRIKLQAILEVYNAFNTVNAQGFIQDLDSPSFGEPTFWGEPRRTQIGFRIEF